ncbi:heterocyst frequency control protein PatD [Pannus brasiliensis]|uniref:heterocyst frequency control protein PatD n=1 Tax=Pannus brasiliensis TaxID=1579216 RepID=UPI002FCD84D2
MLPTIYRESYEILLDRLMTLAGAIDGTDTESRDREFRDLRAWMDTRVLSLTDDNLEGETRVRWQRIQTEIVRSWRLLQTDWLFLASSRQSLDRRLTTVRERLNTLAGYCRALLDPG